MWNGISSNRGETVTSKSAQNAATIRELYQAIANRDFGRYLSLLSEEIVYYAAGNCLISGVHKGKDEVRRIGAITFEETKGTHRVEMKSLVATDSHVAVVDTWRASRNGKSIEMDNLLVYTLEDGKVTEIREFLGDEKAHDAFWK